MCNRRVPAFGTKYPKTVRNLKSLKSQKEIRVHLGLFTGWTGFGKLGILGKPAWGVGVRGLCFY